MLRARAAVSVRPGRWYSGAELLVGQTMPEGHTSLESGCQVMLRARAAVSVRPGRWYSGAELLVGQTMPDQPATIIGVDVPGVGSGQSTRYTRLVRTAGTAHAGNQTFSDQPATIIGVDVPGVGSGQSTRYTRLVRTAGTAPQPASRAAVRVGPTCVPTSNAVCGSSVAPATMSSRFLAAMPQPASRAAVRVGPTCVPTSNAVCGSSVAPATMSTWSPGFRSAAVQLSRSGGFPRPSAGHRLTMVQSIATSHATHGVRASGRPPCSCRGQVAFRAHPPVTV